MARVMEVAQKFPGSVNTPRVLMFIFLFSWMNMVQAKVEIVQFEDPVEQSLYRTLINELRCLVCQNQNLADSNADLAIDLRKKVRGLINQGKSYDDIVEYMVSRYGEFVMYRPPFNRSTLFLWLSPAVLLVVALSAVALRRRRQIASGNTGIDAGFDSAQHEKVRALLQNLDNRG